MKLRYVFILLIITLALAYFLQPRYAIKLERPFKVGDSFVLAVTGSKKQTVTVRIDDVAKDTTETKYSFEFAADVKVLAVDERGEPAKQELSVAKFVRIESDNTKTPLIASGTRIVYEAGENEPAFTSDGQALSKEAKTGLTSILSGKGRDHFEQTFGNTSRVKPGDEWAVNTAESARYFRKNGIMIDPGNLSGKVKFIGIKKFDGIDCMHVWSQLIADNFTAPDSHANAHQVQSFDGFFPIDPTQNIRYEGYLVELNWNAEAKHEDHKIVTQNIVTEQTSVERQYSNQP